ncbi:hypothetical protein MMC25_000883 [Agyrium rufum]|nr:hypothetical protein [Agyrium rufum]
MRFSNNLIWAWSGLQQLLQPSRNRATDMEFPVTFSKTWQVLGPFQIGTREATWGADPLEHLGGFRALQYDSDALFRTSLALNGTTAWSLQPALRNERTPLSSKVALEFRFANVDWANLQSVFGWSALQYQGWARGAITIEGSDDETITLYTDQILEYWIDGQNFFGGDMYEYRKAPLVIRLSPGPHTLDIRLIRDVRAMGGVGEPTLNINVEAALTSIGLILDPERTIVPELVEGKLASSCVSIPLRNTGADWLYVSDVTSGQGNVSITTHQILPLGIAPGQTRSLAAQVERTVGPENSLSILLWYHSVGDQAGPHQSISISLKSRKTHETSRFTFLHPSGVCSYAVLQPPSSKALSHLPSSKALPVLVNLHGAGVEADSEEIRRSFNEVPDLPAWTLFPTGGTPWSGDDWHTWGFADFQAAIAAIPTWIQKSGWKGPGVDTKKLLVSGHSNGGQGAWYTLTHLPDHIIGAAPVSGYSSIQTYISYNMWHESDPRVASILGTSLANYRHELLTENFAGIPVLQQHGGADDNVPPFNSRRLSQLIVESNGTSDYVELPGKGHWFEGVMTSKPLQQFYSDVLETGSLVAELPEQLSFVISNSADMGSRASLQVDQLESPDQLGKVQITHVLNPNGPESLKLTTSNIKRFHVVDPSAYKLRSLPMTIDQSIETLSGEALANGAKWWFVKQNDGSWRFSIDSSWQSLQQRYGRQLGSMDAFLRTNSRFVVQYRSTETLPLALQVSRNLYQYFSADTEIVSLDEPLPAASGNKVCISIGFPACDPSLPDFALQLQPKEGVVIRDSSGRVKKYQPTAGLGAIFLRPLPNEGLELVIWGHDEAGLRTAARLVPMLTGVGQPDFVVVGPETMMNGASGALAMGFFDYKWKVSQASFFR